MIKIRQYLQQLSSHLQEVLNLTLFKRVLKLIDKR